MKIIVTICIKHYKCGCPSLLFFTIYFILSNRVEDSWKKPIEMFVHMKEVNQIQVSYQS